jgi:hypothetical protein
MSDIKRRVKQLEKTTGIETDNRPYLTLTKDLDDTSILKGNDGNQYHIDDLPGLEERYHIIIISWTKDWPPGLEDSPNHITMTWSEDE